MTFAKIAMEAQRRANDGTMTKTQAEAIQMSVGMNGDPDGLLMDDQLMKVFDISRAACFDCVHTALQEGCTSHEMDLFLDHLSSKRDMGPRYWHNFLENGWCFPAFQKQKGKALHELFSRRRSDEQYKKVKARSSELLSLYALVRHGVEQKCRPRTRHRRTPR